MKLAKIAIIYFLIIASIPAIGFSAGHAPEAHWDTPLDLSGLTNEVEIAHWNIRIFSNRSRNNEELNHIADIIQKYDFVAISELRDLLVLNRLQEILKNRGLLYDYIASSKVGKQGSRHKELYSFFYNKETGFEIVQQGQLYPDTEDKFVRDPYWATFKIKSFDFSIVVTHIVWGRRVSDRRAEIRALADVYNYVQEANGKENDILLVGDFNRNPNDQRAWQPLKDIPGMTILFHLPKKSHIKDSSLYDNILFQSVHLKEYAHQSGIDRFDETKFDNNDREANLAVSDHRPVWAVFRIDLIDDD